MKEIRTVTIETFRNNIFEENVADAIIEEAPLQIVIDHGKIENRQRENLSVTMRTPGDDIHLVTGFLFCEDVVKKASDILSVKYIGNTGNKNSTENILLVELTPNVVFDLEKKKRNFISSAACGFCGKTVADIQQDIPYTANKIFYISSSMLRVLPGLLNASQHLFSQTGGVHAVALFNKEADLVHIAEDVGRHNAMDKLVGAMLLKNSLPLNEYIILFSGRLGYELVQKSIMAGISVICAIGAPSSLAVEMGKEYGLTIVGFLKKDSFNIYCGAERIIQS